MDDGQRMGLSTSVSCPIRQLTFGQERLALVLLKAQIN